MTALINKHVNKGTTSLNLNFVDPNIGAHTQQIESSWRALKRRLSRGGIKQKDLGLHFAEYLWFQKNRYEPFKAIVADIARYC